MIVSQELLMYIAGVCDIIEEISEGKVQTIKKGTTKQERKD